MSSQINTQAISRDVAGDTRTHYARLAKPTRPVLQAPSSTLIASSEVKACPIGVGRLAVPILALPSPDAVPSPAELAQAVPGALLSLCRASLARPGSRHSRAKAALAARIAPAPALRISPSAYQLATSQPSDPETHDEFFRIRRCDTAPPERFLLGLFNALQVLRRDLQETMTSLPDSRLAVLAGALQATLATALGAEAIAPLRWTRQEGQAPPDNAGLRWIRGHQIFAVLSQSMIFALNGMEHGDLTGDAAVVGKAADLMADLLAASAVSLELTGDFSDSYYREVVRVGMESPFLPRGFSGLLSNDHRQLAALMKRLRPTIDRLQAQQPEKHARIVDNLSAVYASHKHVCARFVGAEQSSLLMARQSGRSAVEQIDKFKAMRLRSWTPVEGRSCPVHPKAEPGT